MFYRKGEAVSLSFIIVNHTASCRKRASALLIGPENHESESLDEIRETAEAIAGQVVEVRSLDDLAGV